MKPTIPGSTGRSLVAVGIVALILRVAWVIIAAREPTFLGDPLIYRNYGLSLAEGQGYVSLFSGEPTAYFPPGYPFFVGAVTFMEQHLPSPDLPTTLGFVQALAGTTTVLLTMSVARRWWGARSAVAVGLALALAPNLIIHSALLLSETLHMLVVSAILWMAVAATEATRPAPYSAAMGVLLGLSVLIRPQGALIGVVILAYWWFAGARLRHRIGPPLLAAGCALATVVPWTVRNAVVMESFVPVSTNVGDNLCIGFGPDAYGGFRLAEDCRVESRLEDGSRSEVLHNDQTTRIALEAIADDPVRAIAQTPERLWGTVSSDHDGVTATLEFGTSTWLSSSTERILSTVSDLWWFTIAGAAVAATLRFRLWRDGRGLLLLGCTLATFAAPALSFSDPRFKLPALVFIALLACRWWADGEPESTSL